MTNVQLMENESIIYQGKSWQPFGAVAVCAVISLFVMISAPAVGMTFLLSSAVGAVSMYIKLKTAIFLITNKRVIIRVGVLTHRSLELNLNKVESVYVQTSFTDRLNKMGTLVVSGTGGTKESFKDLADPNTFKIKLQEQLDVVSRPAKTG